MKTLEDEEFELYGSLEDFKNNFKSSYHGYYKNLYPDSTFILYLEILKKLYSKESVNRKIQINKNKEGMPEWVVTDEQKEFHQKLIDFDKKLYVVFCDILYFLSDEITILESEKSEIDNRIMSLSNVEAKKEIVELSAPERLQLLWELGFDDLPMVKKLDVKQYKKLMITILKFNKRDIEGYINDRNGGSSESRFMITNKHKEKVNKYLLNL